MKLAGLLILLLSNQGYWIGGEASTVTIRAAVQGGQGGLPNADLSWVLMLDGVKLSDGTARLKNDGSDTTLSVTPPDPRTRVILKWSYRLTDKDGKLLETGDVPINLFQRGILDGTAKRAQSKSIVIWDHPAGISELLSSAKIPFTRIDDASKLLPLKPDVVIVGPDILGEQLLEQSSLDALASSDASVMILRQSRPDRVMRFALQDRRPPTTLQWRLEHPLLSGLSESDVQSWINPSRDLKVVQLPPNEAAVELGFYPATVPSNAVSPIDAVLVTQAVGRGRIVMCQIPLDHWMTDPRSQLFLRNAIDYLLTRPEPTPRPSDRAKAEPPTQPATRSIQF